MLCYKFKYVYLSNIYEAARYFYLPNNRNVNVYVLDIVLLFTFLDIMHRFICIFTIFSCDPIVFVVTICDVYRRISSGITQTILPCVR